VRSALASGIAAILLLAHAAPRAQVSPSSPADSKTVAAASDSTTLPEVVIEASHYENAVGSSDAASQGTVRGERLQDLPLLRPGEVLETIPGVVVTQHSGDGKANQYFLRGYNLDHGTDFATFIEGVPVNMPTNAHGQGYTDANYLIPEIVERINYGKGPYFAEDGDFSSAGSARIQYRNRLDRDFASLTGGTFGYRRGLFAGSTTLGQKDPGPDTAGNRMFGLGGATLLGAVEFLGQNGPWDQPEGLHKFNGLARLSDGNSGNGWSLAGMYYDASWRSTDQVPLDLIQSGQLGRFSSLDSTDGGNTGRFILSGEWHSRNGTGYTRISAYAQHYHLQLWSNFTYFESNPVQGDQFEQFETRNMVGGEAVRGWSHRLLGRDLITEVGVQVRHDAIHVGLANTQYRVPYAIVTDDKVNITSTGLYLQNTALWTNWLRSVVGLREQKVFMDMDALAVPQNTGNATGSKFLPKLSLIFGPWAKTEYFFNIGKGFHSNDARGVINKVDMTGASTVPVPALVGSLGKEVGLRTEIVPGLQSSVALWSLNSDSELVYSADSGTTEPNGASRRWGVEWNNHMTPARWLLLDADLAWTRARFANMNDNGDIGDYIPNAVSKVALLAATVREGTWSGGVVTRYIGSYPLTQDGSLRAPSAIVTNLRLQREFSRDLSMQFDVLNLFNREYFDIAYGQDFQVIPTSPLVPVGTTVHPGEPRQIRLTAKWRF